MTLEKKNHQQALAIWRKEMWVLHYQCSKGKCHFVFHPAPSGFNISMQVRIQLKLMWEKCLPLLPEGWCCNLQADREGCSLRAMMWPGATNITTTIQKLVHITHKWQHFKVMFMLRVVGFPCQYNKRQYLVKHIGRQADHGEVVNNQNNFEVYGFPVFHQARPGPDHTEVNQKDEWHRDGGVDQKPWVSPLVCNITRALCQGLSGFSQRPQWIRKVKGFKLEHGFRFIHDAPQKQKTFTSDSTTVFVFVCTGNAKIYSLSCSSPAQLRPSHCHMCNFVTINTIAST